MPINAETPIATSTANGVTTVFPYSFTVLKTGDLVVTATDTLGNVTTYTYGVDYTLSGIGTSAGSVTFGVAPANGLIITRYRSSALSRATDYQQNGDLLSDTLDSDFDRLWMALQERVTNDARSVRAPAGEILSTLPSANSRLGKFLAFDATTGDVSLVTGQSGSALALAALLVGSTGAANVGFQLTATQSAIRLLNLKLSEWVSVTDFKNNDGSQVLGDYNGSTGRDNTTGFQAAINFALLSANPGVYGTNSPASGTPVIFVSSGNYKLNGTLTANAKFHLRGDGPAERATGSRLLQFNNAVDTLQITPTTTGMSFSVEDITFANTGTGAGHQIHVVGSAGACNSSRIQRCFFGTPASLAINYERGDDVVISHNTFDSSAGSSIGLGTSTSTNVVSALRLTHNDFFEVPTRCVLLYNVVGATITNNHVTRQSATRTNYFIDAYNTLPYQIKDVVVANNVLNSVDCVMKATAFVNLTITSNDGTLMGAGAGATLSCFEWTGACSNLVLGQNNMSGNWDTKNFYNDAGGTVSGASVIGNNVTATGGTGTAIVASNSTGKFAPNTLTGFSRNYTLSDYIAAGLSLNESQTLTYGAAIATDASKGSELTITATNGTAFTVSNPTNPSVGQLLEYTIRNNAGGALGALTFDTLFKIGAAWAQPANGFSRSIGFRWNGTNWVEKYRAAADISN